MVDLATNLGSLMSSLPNVPGSTSGPWVALALLETEGHWWFKDKTVKTAFDQVKQSDVADWIEKETTQDGVNSIKSQLQSQMDYIKKGVNNDLPWGNQVFKVKF
jgi:hypothetical protein